MHGQFIRSMDRQLTTEKNTILWLSMLKEYNESEIITAQNQTLQTKCDNNITNSNREQMQAL
jgi:hypothetical protein